LWLFSAYVSGNMMPNLIMHIMVFLGVKKLIDRVILAFKYLNIMRGVIICK
jgi:hypothetical protein